MNLDESWERLPQARVRMREQDLAILIKALGPGGIFIGGQPRVASHEDGILITLCANAGTIGKIIALPIEIFIPCEVAHAQENSHEEDPIQEVDSGQEAELLPDSNEPGT